jgi:RHS repeat-associated protein
VGSYSYDAYGNVLSVDGEIAKDNSVRYASYYYDSEMHHYYLQARYYDPQNGNFLAMDPDSGDDDDTLSQNGYTYAENNPMTNVDPDGNFIVLVYAIPVIGEYALIGTAGFIAGYETWKFAKKLKKYYVKRHGFRGRYRSKKKAKKRAKEAGDGAEPIHHPDGQYGPHYHPNVPKKDPRSHDHYYYPKRRR